MGLFSISFVVEEFVTVAKIQVFNAWSPRRKEYDFLKCIVKFFIVNCIQLFHKS